MQAEPNILPTINRFKPGSLGEEITSQPFLLPLPTWLCGEGLTRRRKMGVGSSFPEGGMGRGTPAMKEQTETQLLCGERGRAGGEAAPTATWQIG